MKILVTGANGYLGSGVVKELCSRGHRVIAADFTVDRVCADAVKYACDLFSVEDPYNFFDQPEVLLHMAWRDGFVHNSPAHIQDFPRHYRFLEKVMGTGIRRVAVMGTMHEIGFFEGSVDENTLCNPMNLYGISKDALRKSVQLLSSQTGTAYQWLRAFYIVSGQTNGSSIFSKLAAAEESGQCEFPFTTGQNQYDFLDYDDFCAQVAAAVVQDRVDGVINICSGRPEKLSDRVEQFIKDNGFSIKLRYGAFPERPYDSKAIWGNDAKIKQILQTVESR